MADGENRTAVMEEVEALVAFRGRLAGTDAERRAARHLAGRLEELGREAEVERVDVWPAFHLTHALHALISIAGSLVSVASPPAGAALALVAVVSTFGDATGLFFLVRRLTGRRASQNVVSREDRGRRGTLSSPPTTTPAAPASCTSPACRSASPPERSSSRPWRLSQPRMPRAKGSCAR
jgi:hypothetical protein